MDTQTILINTAIIIIGLIPLFIGYKIGLGKLKDLNLFFKIVTWWFRIGLLYGVAATINEEKYHFTLLIFFILAFLWADYLHLFFQKIVSIKNAIIEPFKPKTQEEKNQIRIKELEDEIQKTKSSLKQEAYIKNLENELDTLLNPKEQIKEEPKEEIRIEEKPKPKPDPVVEENKKELRSVLGKLGF